MIKIVHTSDLHIGRRLYETELAEDQKLFFGWLTALIEKEKADVLIIAGDIFDVANPSSESRKMYYELLVQLSRLKCRVIIIGGNHDSPAMLEAPGELLKELDIHVTGGLTEDLREMLIPVFGDDGKPALVIASVPFLRDGDLRKHMENESYEDRLEAVRSGIIRIYSEAAETCQKLYPGIPAMAMGHLFVQGGIISESEREIQVGNLAGIESDKLSTWFSIYALGHLHNPQAPGNNHRIFYSGAPVQLSFSERNNENRVMLYTLENGKISAVPVSVPVRRRLVKFSGSVDELKKSLNELKTDPDLLKTLIELEAIEETNDPSRIMELETIVGEFSNDNAEIIKNRIRFPNKGVGTADLYDAGTSIEDLKPSDIFARKIGNDKLDENTSGMLKEAFAELLEEVLQNQKE